MLFDRSRRHGILFTAAATCCCCALEACVDDAPRPLSAFWGCLADPPVEDEQAVLIRLELLDETSEEPVAGARVALCTRSDLECASPAWVGLTNGLGVVSFTLIDEYLEITAPGYRATLAMGIDSLEVNRGRKVPIDVHFDLYPADSFTALAAASGVGLDASYADFEVLVRDCAYESAGGVTLDIDQHGPDTVVRYLVNDLPSASAAETDVASGSALFFNVPKGLHSITASLAETGAPITVEGGVLAAIARPGWLTQVTVVPASVDITEIEGE